MEKKKILITGANSYVGTSFEKWVSKYDTYQVDTINLRNTILHVAAIVHKKEKRGDEALYNEVNTELAYEVAKKAKKEGVKQFIFMSSIAVYGLEGSLFRVDKIDYNTPEKPKTLYGKSKLNAERVLQTLSNGGFNIVIIRAPMIYGIGCKGNYDTLRKLAYKIKIFPKVNNIRSVLYIDNLCEFIRLIIKSGESGIFFPQDKTFMNTSKTVINIASHNNKVIHSSVFLGFLVRIAGTMGISKLKKAFGNLIIDKKLSKTFEYKYCIISEKYL